MKYMRVNPARIYKLHGICPKELKVSCIDYSSMTSDQTVKIIYYNRTLILHIRICIASITIDIETVMID